MKKKYIVSSSERAKLSSKKASILALCDSEWSEKCGVCGESFLSINEQGVLG